MKIEQRIQAFVQLGRFLNQFAEDQPWQGYETGVSQTDFDEFTKAIEGVHIYNGWFTSQEVRRAIRGIASWLNKETLENWLSKYNVNKNKTPKTVAVIMAGNIPLVGFHDAMSVLLSGNNLLAKFSSDDELLMPLVLKYLTQLEPEFYHRIRIADGRLNGFDAVIATGSDNSSRYFEHYFGKYPHIIRKNRTSVAVLDGSETREELTELGHDIFDFFGLGCRNVSKIFIPEDFDLDRFFGAVFGFKEIIQHKKYANNYDYHKALYLMNQDKLIENGFLLLKEDDQLHSPLGTLFYERYDHPGEVDEKLNALKDQLQCVIGKNFIPFGKAQTPAVDDYADGVDTMKFLSDI